MKPTPEWFESRGDRKKYEFDLTMVFNCHAVIGTGDLQPREHQFVPRDRESRDREDY